jgi:Tfp pilus assembly protein PilO
MDTKKLIALLQGSIKKDYTYNFFFFIVFALLIMMAIRPNLITAFNLQRELQELKLKDNLSEEKILKIVAYQTTMQQYRDALNDLDTAIPKSPKLAQIVTDLRNASINANVPLNSLSIQSVQFIKDSKGQEALSIEANIETSGGLSNLGALINSIYNQLRLKTVDKISINSSDGTTYNFNILIKSYFL